MEEIWKPIPDYETLYEASDLGQIKSVRNGKIRAQDQSMKYNKIGLSKNGKVKKFYVHQLIAMTFLNHKPCGHELEVNHKNFNRRDNRACNLEIVTQRENSNRKHLKSGSKFVGVHLHKDTGKWMSLIGVNGKRKYLGLHKNEIDAANAYQKALSNIT